MPVFEHHFTTDLLLISESETIQIDNLSDHTASRTCACILSRRGQWKITPPGNALLGLMTLDPFDCIRSRLSDSHAFDNYLVTPSLTEDFLKWWWQIPEQLPPPGQLREQLFTRLRISQASVTGSESRYDQRVTDTLRRVLALENFETAMDTLKQTANLSYSRLRTLVKNEAGINLKTNLAGYQVKRFVEAHADNRSLTESAHTVGYHDSAHLNKAIRRAFNLSPSMMVDEFADSKIFVD